MVFEESQSRYTALAEVFVAFDTGLNKELGARIKKPKRYRIYRSDARLGLFTPLRVVTRKRRKR
jgi:hypothetical protein